MGSKYLALFSTLLASLVKMLLPVLLIGVLKDNEYSEFINLFNIMFISGYIFSLEHHTHINRKFINLGSGALDRNYRLLRMSICYAPIKALFGVIAIALLFDIKQPITLVLAYLAIFLELLLVDYLRVLLASGEYLKNAIISATKIGLSSSLMLFGLLNLDYSSSIVFFILLISNLLFFIALIGVEKIPYKRVFTGHYYGWKGLHFKLLTRKTSTYIVISVAGFLIPIVDKYVIYLYEQHDFVKVNVILGVVGGLISAVVLQLYYNPNYRNIVSVGDVSVVNRLAIKILSVVIVMTIFIMFCLNLVVYLPETLSMVLGPYSELILNDKLYSIHYILAVSLIPISTLYTTLLYSRGLDTIILKLSVVDFASKVIGLLVLCEINAFQHYAAYFLVSVLAVLAIKIKFVYSNRECA